MTSADLQRGRTLVGQAGQTALARVIAQGAQFAGFVAAARVLGPADFGLFALVLVASTLLMVLASAGWSERLLSVEGERPFLHAIALIGGLCAGLAVLAGGYVASIVFEEPTVFHLCALFAVSLPLLTLCKFHQAMLLADARIGRGAFVQISMELSALVALLVALHAGLGILALGLSKIVYGFVGFSIATWSTRWLAMALPSRARLAEMLRFTRNLVASGLTFFVQENAAVLLIGVFLGPAGAGFYRAGARIAGAVAEVLGEVTRMLAWTTLRAARADGRARDAFQVPALRLIGVVAACALPAFVGLAFVAADLTRLLLGPEWGPTAAVISLLALRRLALSLDPVIAPLLLLSDAAPLVLKLALVSAGASVLALVITAPHGVSYAAAGQLLAGVVLVPVQLSILERYAGSGGLAALKAASPGIVATGAMCAMLFGGDWAVAGYGLSGSKRLLATVGVGVVVYAAVLVVVLPRSMRRVLLPFGKDPSPTP